MLLAIDHLLCARESAKLLTYVSSFEPHKSLERSSCTPIFKTRTGAYVGLKPGKSDPWSQHIKLTMNSLVGHCLGLERCGEWRERKLAHGLSLSEKAD